VAFPLPTSYATPGERDTARRGGPCPVDGCDVDTVPPHAFTGQIVSWHYTDPPDADPIERAGLRVPHLSPPR